MWELSDPIFGDIDLQNLAVDQAYINITSNASNRYWMYTLSDDCIRCPFAKFRDIAPHRSALVKFSTFRRFQWKVFDEDLGPYAFDNE